MSANDRIQWLHKNTADGRYPNAGLLAEQFGISHRQAQRDVDYLKTALGAPLAYSAKHRGFYYKTPYTLPTYTSDEGEADLLTAVAGGEDVAADREIVQMQIPYSAVLEIPGKLTRLHLKQFIKGQENGRFLCEFHNVELFLGVLFSTEADITLVEPEWLRERLVRSAERILKNHKRKD